MVKLVIYFTLPVLMDQRTNEQSKWGSRRISYLVKSIKTGSSSRLLDILKPTIGGPSHYSATTWSLTQFVSIRGLTNWLIRSRMKTHGNYLCLIRLSVWVVKGKIVEQQPETKSTLHRFGVSCVAMYFNNIQYIFNYWSRAYFPFARYELSVRVNKWFAIN